MCPFRLKAPLIFEMLMPSLSRSQIVDIVDGIGFFAYPSPFYRGAAPRTTTCIRLSRESHLT